MTLVEPLGSTETRLKNTLPEGRLHDNIINASVATTANKGHTNLQQTTRMATVNHLSNKWLTQALAAMLNFLNSHCLPDVN